jgi:integrase
LELHLVDVDRVRVLREVVHLPDLDGVQVRVLRDRIVPVERIRRTVLVHRAEEGLPRRVIWRLVKRVAARAGVQAHVHALRAAFAAYYLSLHPGDVEALKELLGHRNISTTQVYLRKFDKAKAMERVRSLSWADVAKNGDGLATESSQSAANVFESLAGVGAGGFEPP